VADDEIPTEALEAAARALHEHDREVAAQHGDSWSCWSDLTDDQRASYDSAIGDVLAAATPYLIAEGRRLAAADIRHVDVQMVADLDGDTARVGLTVAARIAESGDAA
jgi:hypothetical protein